MDARPTRQKDMCLLRTTPVHACLSGLALATTPIHLVWRRETQVVLTVTQPASCQRLMLPYAVAVEVTYQQAGGVGEVVEAQPRAPCACTGGVQTTPGTAGEGERSPDLDT